ncbi:nucleotidyltransferase family protein [Tropicimonas marinistellae]|uniref:nucleotidyltransferase family protein n=1 Tax=Tropicimonas marinistellae TaxID=1739787 RepID=UPI00082FF8A1|nr:nucleotidyltransferase family protein [Tropicimonas marinistellae]
MIHDPSTARGSHLPRTSPFGQVAACIRGDVNDETDWMQCIATANEHLITPRLYLSLCRDSVAGSVEPEALAYLEEIFHLNGERNSRFAAQLEELTVAMNRAGIVPLAIKGAAVLAEAEAVENVARMLADLDIVIDRGEVEVADRVLRGLGYDVFADSADCHSTGSYYRVQDVGAVDLHFRLGDRMAEVISPRELEERTREVPFGAARIRVPDLTLQLVMNVAHDMLHDEGMSKGDINLRYLLELADLARAGANRFDQVWIARKCRHWKFELALELQSRLLLEMLGDVPVPSSRRSRLGWLLHRRRIWKTHHPALAKLEWDMLWRVKNVMRRMRLDPTPLLALYRSGSGHRRHAAE